MNKEARRWITIKEAATRLGLHWVTMYRLAGRGEIPCARLGRKRLIDWQKLEAELEAQIDKRRK
jgi:excisionase family DNA binding protein